MKKKLFLILFTIISLFIIAGIAGIKWFNDLWFKETPNHLSYTALEKPISFEWNQEDFNDFSEPHAAMVLPVKIAGIQNPLYFQLDTGSPYSMIYGNTLQSLSKHGVQFEKINRSDNQFIQNIQFQFSDSPVNMNGLYFLEGYGEHILEKDTTTPIKIGTIGADFMDQKITVIDFQKQTIQLYDERPPWMSSLPSFKPFDFSGRRFMLPAIIEETELELFYDSGSSAFGLITSKHRYDQFADKNMEEKTDNGNRFGESLTFHHKDTDKMMRIGNHEVSLKRVSYIDIYTNFQRFMTPFTRIGGWLGNKPFLESVLILDTRTKEFLLL